MNTQQIIVILTHIVLSIDHAIRTAQWPSNATSSFTRATATTHILPVLFQLFSTEIEFAKTPFNSREPSPSQSHSSRTRLASTQNGLSQARAHSNGLLTIRFAQCVCSSQAYLADSFATLVGHMAVDASSQWWDQRAHVLHLHLYCGHIKTWNDIKTCPSRPTPSTHIANVKRWVCNAQRTAYILIGHILNVKLVSKVTFE